MRTIANRLLPRVLLPICTCALVFGYADYVRARRLALEAQQAHLVESSAVTAKLVDEKIGSYQALVDSVLFQEDLANYFLFAFSGLLDLAEGSRLALEASALRMTATRPQMKSLELFKGSGERFIAIMDGRRSLTPLMGPSSDWWEQAGARWSVWPEPDGELRLVKSYTLDSGLGVVFASIQVEAAGLFGGPLALATSSRARIGASIVDSSGAAWFRLGVQGGAGEELAARVPLGKLPAMVALSASRQDVLDEVRAARVGMAGFALLLGLSLAGILWMGLRGVVLNPLRSVLRVVLEVVPLEMRDVAA